MIATVIPEHDSNFFFISQVDTAITASNGDDMFKHKWPSASEAEPEERRMSDLSDWASSVTSSVDIQVTSTYTHWNLIIVTLLSYQFRSSRSILK